MFVLLLVELDVFYLYMDGNWQCLVKFSVFFILI